MTGKGHIVAVVLTLLLLSRVVALILARRRRVHAPGLAKAPSVPMASPTRPRRNRHPMIWRSPIRSSNLDVPNRLWAAGRLGVTRWSAMGFMARMT